jgi:hypothetical protein
MQANNNNLTQSGQLTGAMKLTRNNMEFAGLIVYFAAIAFFFAFAFIVMVFELGPGTREKAANDHSGDVASASYLDSSVAPKAALRG